MSTKPTPAPVAPEERGLTVVQQINKELEAKQKEGYIVLGVPTLQHPPALHRLVVKKVTPDLTITNEKKVISTDLYPQAGGMVSFRRNFYDKLADAAGIKWAYHAFRRMDSGRDPRFCHYQAVGLIKGMDGQWRPVVADKALHMDTMEQELRDNYRAKAEAYLHDPKEGPDFKKAFPTPRDVEAWIEEKVRKDALQIQKHIVARAQTGAMNRVVEKALSLRKAYKPEELKKGFVFATLMFSPDPDHPMDRQHMLDEASGAKAALWAPAPATEVPPEIMHSGRSPEYPEVDGEIIEFERKDTAPVGSAKEEAQPVKATEATTKPASSTDPGTRPSPAEQARADFQAADVEQQLKILNELIQRKQFDTKKVQGNPAKWTALHRLQFYDHLIGLPDPGGPTTAPLPWE